MPCLLNFLVDYQVYEQLRGVVAAMGIATLKIEVDGFGERK
jgi:hypothetical protein